MKHRANAIGWAALLAAAVWLLGGCGGPPIKPSEIEAHFAPVAAYRDGASRAPLLELEKFIHAHSGNPAAMRQIERRLIGLAVSGAPVEARAFACEQLGLIGGPASAKALGGLLEDEGLAFHARQALQRIPDPSAGQVLRDAMGRSEGADREALRQSLVARGEIEAPKATFAPGKGASRRSSGPEASAGTLSELLGRASAGDSTGRDAALAALERVVGQGADEAILASAAEGTAEVRAKLIGVLAARGARGAVPGLARWAKEDPDVAVRVAAMDALGRVGGGTELRTLLSLYVAAGSQPEERAAQDAAWALYRRVGELAALKSAVLASVAGAPQPRQDVLKKLLARAEELARSPGPTADTLEVEPLPTGEGDPIFPDGHRLVAYHDCGLDDLSGGGAGPFIRTAQGKPFKFGGRDPVRSALFDARQLRFDVGGLRDDGEYVLGLTWWDADGKGRKQSVHLGTGEPVAWRQALPAAMPVAFHNDRPTWARVQVPLPAGVVKGGAFRVAVNNEGGPNVVVSEMWVLERQPGAQRKRVLIVAGDDWKGHLWRQTGPEFASILREDGRFEVTICESPWILASPMLAHYDAVMLHFKNYAERLPLGPEVWAGLEKFAGSGKGVVLAHFGCGAFEDWEGFGAVAGRVWDKTKRGHDPYGPFRVLVKDAAHPITRGIGDFDTTDELYTCLKGDAAIRVLCGAVSKIDGREHPMAFVNGAENLRVFHCTLGHDVASLKNAGARALYRSGVAWACGIEGQD
ncbi:MAG: ThuA domain-containing protein [Verrucomicrobiae bacterium]|nr:ThuA domain-containing protein [Verrucomicrobiae bacterium]